MGDDPVKIVHAYPPNYAQLKEHFKLPPSHNIVFAWGETMFSPNLKNVITDAIKAHEAAHGARQLSFAATGDAEQSVRAWWNRYIEEIAFRLDEEVIGHRAEFKHIQNSGGASRRDKEKALEWIASKLSSPLYGGLIMFNDAVRELTK